MNSGRQVWKGHLELDCQEPCKYGFYPEGSESGSCLTYAFVFNKTYSYIEWYKTK